MAGSPGAAAWEALAAGRRSGGRDGPCRLSDDAQAQPSGFVAAAGRSALHTGPEATAHRARARRWRGARLRTHWRDPGARRERHPPRPRDGHLGRQPGRGALCVGKERSRVGRAGRIDGRIGVRRLVVPGARADPWRGPGEIRAPAHRWPQHRADAHSAGHRRDRSRQRPGDPVPTGRSGRRRAGVERGSGGVPAGQDRHPASMSTAASSRQFRCVLRGKWAPIW